MESYRSALNEAQVASIKTQNNYNINNTKNRLITISEQSALQQEKMQKAISTTQMTAKDTPTTPQCDFKS
jgi:hypothetical protein